jgi:DNA gyrase inhibitor GyrI
MTTNGRIEDLVRQFMRMPDTHNLGCDPSRRLQRPIDNPEIAEPAQTLLDLGLAVKCCITSSRITIGGTAIFRGQSRTGTHAPGP